MTLKPDHLIFLDIEASGLGPDSWPIEVGLAWIVDQAVQTWSSLIRPEPDWDPDAWSDQSAIIHNIPREDLDAAPKAIDVAHEVMERIAARHVISDAPGFDRMWMQRIFEAIDIVPPAFMHIDKVVASACNGDRNTVRRVLAQLDEEPRPHRAGADAARLAAAILYGMKMGRLSDGTSR